MASDPESHGTNSVSISLLWQDKDEAPVQSACLAWTDQSNGQLGLDGLQATQAPELHSKILCKILTYKASATIYPPPFVCAPPHTIILHVALLRGDFQ
jgi:hypothetical protein